MVIRTEVTVRMSVTLEQRTSPQPSRRLRVGLDQLVARDSRPST